MPESTRIEFAPVAILAGGLATRLRPITSTVPKSMAPVAGRPFLEHQIEYLKGQGVRRAVLCTGYLGGQIQAHFGNGERFGVQIDYSFDGPKLLGTGGAIKRALPLLGEVFFVLYGDSYLPINYRAVLDSFERSGAPALMTVFRNRNHWDRSNVLFENGRIIIYDKENRTPEMQHIDYGLSAFRANAFECTPEYEPWDLASLLKSLVKSGDVAGFEAAERFYEIGSPAGLSELDRLLSTS